jgi:hypothetical protein
MEGKHFGNQNRKLDFGQNLDGASKFMLTKRVFELQP